MTDKEFELCVLKTFMDSLPKDGYLVGIMEGMYDYCKRQIDDDISYPIVESLDNAHSTVLQQDLEISRLRSQLDSANEWKDIHWNELQVTKKNLEQYKAYANNASAKLAEIRRVINA